MAKTNVKAKKKASPAKKPAPKVAQKAKAKPAARAPAKAPHKAPAKALANLPAKPQQKAIGIGAMERTIDRPNSKKGSGGLAVTGAEDEALALLTRGNQGIEGSGMPDTEGKPNTARGKYVYCIIRTSEFLRFGPIGIGAEPSDVQTVNYKDLAAVVSDIPMGVLDPTREHVLAHQRVNETVMREHTVLPMSFGTVFKTREDILELLRSAYDAFGDVLTKMQNKFEFGLKVLWDREQVLKEIEDEDESVRRLKGEIANQKGSTYFARMQYGRMVDQALSQRSERYVSEIFGGLRDVAVASRANKPIGDKMIMNAAFLISRDKENAFDGRVKDIGARYDNLTFKYTGPWPPYNFVNIRLKLERASGK